MKLHIAIAALAALTLSATAAELPKPDADGWITLSKFAETKRKVDLLLFLLVPVLHVSYGLGFLQGVLEFLVLRRKPSANAACIPLSR